MTEEVASIASGTKKIRTCMLHKTIDKHLLDWQPFIIWHRDYGYIQTHTQSNTHMKHVDIAEHIQVRSNSSQLQKNK